MTSPVSRWILRAGLALVLLLGLVLSLAPVATQWLVTDWLRQQGLTASFEYLEFSPGVGRISLHGMQATNGAERGFALAELELDIALWPLLRHRIVVEKASLKGGRLDLLLQSGRWEVAGLDLNSLGVDRESTSPSSTEPSSTASSSPPAQLSGKTSSATPLSSEKPVEAAPWQVDVQQLALSDLEVCLQQRSGDDKLTFHQCLGLDDFFVRGGVRALLSNAPSVILPSQLQLKKFSVDDQARGLKTFAFDRMTLQQVVLSDKGIIIGELAFHDIAFAERLPEERAHQRHAYHGTLETLRFNTLSASGNSTHTQLYLKELGIEGLSLLLHRSRDVRYPLLRLVDQLTRPFTAPDDKPAEAVISEETGNKEAPAKTSIKIDRISVGQQSRLSWIDEGVTPAVEQLLSDIQFTMANLDSAYPMAMSPLSLSTRVGDFGEVVLKGKAAPFSSTVNAQLDGTITALDLLPFSTYTEQAIAHRIMRGQLSQSLTLKVEQDQMEALFDLNLHKFELQSLAADERPAEATSTLLPLGVALNLLRDGDDRIHLKLPMSGDIHDPDMSFAHIIGVVGRKALTKAVISYYTPFGMVSVASLLADAALTMRFQPLLYDPGQAVAGPEAVERLGKLAQLLVQKPQLSLIFCPVANGSDWQVLFKKSATNAGNKGAETGDSPTALEAQSLPQAQILGLLELADTRAKGIKTALLEKGVSAEQVVLCAASVDLSADSSPRVTVEM